MRSDIGEREKRQHHEEAGDGQPPAQKAAQDEPSRGNLERWSQRLFDDRRRYGTHIVSPANAGSSMTVTTSDKNPAKSTRTATNMPMAAVAFTSFF